MTLGGGLGSGVMEGLLGAIVPSLNCSVWQFPRSARIIDGRVLMQRGALWPGQVQHDCQERGGEGGRRAAKP